MELTAEELQSTGAMMVRVRTAVGDLHSTVIRELASGPWPEPHCGVCRALDFFYDEWGLFKLRYSRYLLPLDIVGTWHGECMTHKAYSPVTYRRCQFIYAAARDSLPSDRTAVHLL